jgi:hypothetical protein
MKILESAASKASQVKEWVSLWTNARTSTIQTFPFCARLVRPGTGAFAAC